MPVRKTHNRSLRQRKAQERGVSRATRSPQEQLELLDQRLGKKIGATKERTRLLALIKETK